MSYEQRDRQDRSADGAGGSEEATSSVAPGKRTLTDRLPRAPAVASVSGSTQPTQQSVADRPTPSTAVEPGPIPALGRETVAAERAAGRGDSDAAVLALGQLVRDAADPMELARVECMVATGRVESPLRLEVWADALAALAPDARAGYARLLRTRRAALTVDGAVERLRAMTRVQADAVAIVRAYRLAGRGSDRVAVEQLAALLAGNGRSIDAVETLLGGAGSDVTVVDDDAPDAPSAPVTPGTPGTPRTSRTPADGNRDGDRAIDQRLARMPAEIAAAYRAAFAQLGDKTPSRNSQRSRTPARTQQPRTSQNEVKPAVRPRASGGAEAGGDGGGKMARVPAEAFVGVGDADKNARLAMLLLVASGVPADLAQWVATCTGEPPDRVRELEDAKADMDAMSPAGIRQPIARRPRPRAPGGYHGYRIFDASGQTMSAEEIDADIARQGYIDVSLDSAFYAEYIAPLLDSPERWAWARADLMALSYQREIDALEEREREDFARSGQHDRQLMERIMRLKGMRLEYATYAADLRSGKTSVTAETGKFEAEDRRLDGLIGDATAKLADARRRLAADLEERRREQPVNPAYRPATGVTPTRDTVQASAEIGREVEELEKYLAQRRQEKSALEEMRVAGDPFPGEVVRRSDRLLREVYETGDGTFKFRSNARATWNAVDGAISGISARLWAGMGGIGEYGGKALSFLTGEPWYGLLGGELSRRAYDTSADIDVYAADRTARASEVLGKTATTLIQVATSTAIYVVMLGPVASGGGVLGAAAIGGNIGATAGSMAALAATGALLSSDKGAGEMATGAVFMGAMPLFAGFGATALRRAVSAFVGVAALDGASQMDLFAAFDAYERSRSYGDALAAATAKVDLDRMFANGLMAAMLAAGGRQARPEAEAPPALRVGDELFRPDGAPITDPAQRAALARSPSVVRVNRPELESIRALARTDPRAAGDLIARARTRDQAFTESDAESRATERDIARLEARPGSSAAERSKLSDLRQRRDRSAAQAEVLSAARTGQPIPRTLLERAGGQVPAGYAESGPGGDFVATPGLAARQSGEWRGQLDAGTKIATDYQAEVETMNRVSRELVAEQGRPSPRADVLARLRAALSAAAGKVQTLHAAFADAVRAGSKTPGETRPTETVPNTETTPKTEKTQPTTEVTDGEPQTLTIDPASAPLGQGAQGTVYAVDVAGKPMAVKVIDGAGTPESALAGARLPTRYGGLGSGQPVKVMVGDVVTDGVLMPRVEGTRLSATARTTSSQRDAFVRCMDAARQDGVVLSDLNAGNIMMRSDGGIAIVDAPMVTFEKFAETTRQVLREAATPERIAADWKLAREEFDWRVGEALRAIEGKLEGGGGRQTEPLTRTETQTQTQTRPQTQTESQPKTTPLEDGVGDIRPTERPPLLDDEAIQDIAARTEADVNNILEGTCTTAAMRNTISAQLRGMKAYVIEIEGLTRLGRILERLGLREGNVGKLLQRLGASLTTSAHAIAAIQGADGGWRYVSWGRVEADYAVFAREVYGEPFLRRGTWETGDHVRWMLAHRWEYPNPTTPGSVQSAELGWTYAVDR